MEGDLTFDMTTNKQTSQKDHETESHPEADEEVITLAHGAGGEAMRSLVNELAINRFEENTPSSEGTVGLSALDDGSAHPLPNSDSSLVVTTDSHVVSPPVFPGGDIGRLSVAGTVNDLAVMGVTDPIALTCSLVIEEGTQRAQLDEIMESMRETCKEAGVSITTGDTKVMGRGELDGPVINTTGVGVVSTETVVADAGLSPGDAIIVSGTVGDHGIALLAEREGFDFGDNLKSDVAPVNDIVRAATDAGRITAMKDPTRGGLATTLNEMAEKANVGIEIKQDDIPVNDAIASAGEILGIDPLSVANEGKVVFGVDPDDKEAVLSAIRAHQGGEEAAIIGTVTEEQASRVVLDTGFGRRYLSEPTGETLPRIC